MNRNCKGFLIVATIIFSIFTFIGLGSAKTALQEMGKLEVGAVRDGGYIEVPYITWGADIWLFYANGGLETTPDSIYGKLGLKIKLVAGDDTDGQIRRYMAGKTPIFRGTYGMDAMKLEIMASDPKTKGVMFLHLSYSLGDHLVVRGKNIKTLADLKGITIVLQKGGPHEALIDDVLKIANLTWNDIHVIWAKDLTGPKGSDCPAEIFRNNPKVDACCVISPDMLKLTGGLKSTGVDAEGLVSGARVLFSTAEMSRSIEDNMVCRKDFYDTHKDWMCKFLAGYFKACEKGMELKKQYETKGSKDYENVLRLAQKIFGTSVIENLEEDGHGMIVDCALGGYPGNVAFFRDPANPNGFEAFQKSRLDFAVRRGYISEKTGFLPHDLDYNSKYFLGYLSNTKVEVKEKFRAEAVTAEIEAMNSGSFDTENLYSFDIYFDVDQMDFDSKRYGKDYEQVIDMASKFRNAVIAVRGHSDVSRTLFMFLKAGMAKGILKRSGSSGNYKYFFKGKELSITDIPKITALIESGEFEGTEYTPKKTLQAALNLSQERAETVVKKIIAYAKEKGVRLDKSQIKPTGVGLRELLVLKPTSEEDAAPNRRVEFRLIKVHAEAMNKPDFDF